MRENRKKMLVSGRISLFVLFVFIILSSCLNPETEKPIAIHKTITSNNGVISFTFDDGSRTIFENGFPALKKYGIPATLYLITEHVGESYCVSWEQVDTLIRDGWEIASHTNTHPKLTEVSDNEIKSELDKSIELLRKHGSQSRAFASPYGLFDKRTLGFIKKRFSSHRKSWEEKFSPETGLNSLEDFEPYCISNFNIECDMTVDRIKKKIDQAVDEKKWLVISFHSIKKGGDIEKYKYQEEKLEQIVEYVSQLVKARKLETKTVSQMVETRKNKEEAR